MWCAGASAQSTDSVELKAALAQYQIGNHKAALRKFKDYAHRDNVYALGNVGYMYLNGRGTSIDYKEAAAYFRKAAEKGLAYAQLSLSIMYAQGMGVPQDMNESRKWHQLAVRQGHAASKYVTAYTLW